MTQTGPTRDKGEQFSRGPVRQPPIEPGRAEQARRIAMLAPPWIPLPPPGYGGIEEVVALRTEALVDRGNDVELFCAPGSSSNAKLRPLLPTSHPESIERALFEADHVGRAFGAFDAAAADDNPFDVVHDHSGYTPLAMTDRIGQPLVHTVHGPFDERHDSVLRPPRREGQRRLHQPLTGELRSGRGEPARRHFNPIDIETWPVGFEKQDYLFWVGRFAPEKGAHRAIAVAKQARRRLILAGVVQSRQERYFANEIQPHIDGDQIQFVGEVGGARKRNLFAERGHS